MKQYTITFKCLVAVSLIVILSSCVPKTELREPNMDMPSSFNGEANSTDQSPADQRLEAAKIDWKKFFHDEDLAALIDMALINNQELNIFLQELEIAKNEVSARRGAYLPSIDLDAEVGADKLGKYTRLGSVEDNLEIAPGKSFPEPLMNYSLGLRASWEIDIWKKLRNAEKSAYMKYLSSQEGRSFLVTNLIAEIANSYYELCALDSQLNIVKQNIGIQRDALKTTKIQKDAARVTELAVRRFEAQVLKTEALQYDLEQKIIETENKINFLLGRFPQSIKRESQRFTTVVPEPVRSGLPSELLQNRPDIRQAELDIAAADLDVKVAEAAFYPSLELSADIGYEAYRVNKLFNTPDSLLYGLAGGITGPLLNRRAITADFYNASAKQRQAVFNYERTILNAFIEASTQISNVKNLERSANLKQKQVDALKSSVDVAGTLFTSARADYSEVLLTQREAIESRFELVETKLRQMRAIVSLYRALGGGWAREANVNGIN